VEIERVLVTVMPHETLAHAIKLCLLNLSRFVVVLS
jgi:hypothetical protein